ncbi:ABC transporter permease [Paraconexibacter sp.]|uniref:ABC transporter permease n=1 Tax=Paraconexibacter sp. TaxID=2949640 RepID=UPI00356844AC
MSTADAAAAVPSIPPPEPVRRRRMRRLERAALEGVLIREVINFRSYWRSATFSATVEPTVYLLAFGFGFGALVNSVGGLKYIEFVGTGSVATAVLFSAAFGSMYGSFIKREYQRTYDAILSTPVDTVELVAAEVLWMGGRAGLYGCVPILVAMVFGLDPSLGMLLVPFIGMLAGIGWAAFGTAISASASTIENFSYVQSAVLTPLFLTAGTFFPLDQLPRGIELAANLNPLYHCVQLVRHAVFGFEVGADLIHLGAMLLFALVCLRIAVRQTQRKLVL